MFEGFIYDLTVAREKSGLRQVDCGHLLGASDHVIFDLEKGNRMPTLREIHGLSIIYGRNFESLHGPLMQQMRRHILQKIETLPEAPTHGATSERRLQMLGNLTHRLLVESQSEYAG